MRKYIIILMLTTFIGGFGFLFITTYSNLAVVINNHTDEEISGLSITYPHLKEEIKVEPIQPGDDIALKIDPDSQASEKFEEGSLELTYKDTNGNVHTETIFKSFQKDYSGDAEITITNIEEDGTLEIDIEDHTAKPKE